MEVKLKKEQLGFLEKYAMCTDQKMTVHEKFQISKKEDKIIFSQKSNTGYLITEIDYKGEQFDNVIFDTITFVSLIKSIPDHTEITITEKGITFFNNTYDIVNTDMVLDDVEEYIRVAKENDTVKFTLKDIDCFNKIRDYAAGDKLETVAYQNNYFVTSNKLYVTAFSKAKEFKLEKDFYFSQEVFILLTTYKIKEVEISVKDEYYFFKLGETFIFIPNKEYILPNMFQDDIREMYEHPYMFSVLKKDIKETLSRMKIVARNNKEGRIYFELSTDKLNIKNTDTQFAVEDIKMTSCSPEIVNISIPLSVTYLSSIIDKCDGNEIIFYCKPETVDPVTQEVDDCISVKIEDETKNYFYILNVLEK